MWKPGIIIWLAILTVMIFMVIILMVNNANETTKTTPARPVPPIPTLERVLRPTATPRPAPMPTYVPAGESLRQHMERRKTALIDYAKNQGLILSCKDKLGNKKDDVAFVLLCTGDQDPTKTDKTNSLVVLVIAANDSTSSVTLYAPDIQEYDNTVESCAILEDHEPDCVTYRSLTFSETMGALFELMQRFEDY